MIVIENKNDQKVEEISVRYDEVVINSLLSTIKELFSYVDNNKLPSRALDIDSQECRWCDYRDICWKIGVRRELEKVNNAHNKLKTNKY